MPTGYRAVFAAPCQIVMEPLELGAPGPGQALLRTERTLISTGTELTMLTGDFPAGSRWAQWVKYPVGVGYSSVATVVEIGEGVDRVKAGDRVASTAGHASHALHPANHLWLLPDGVDAEAGTFATLAEIVLGGIHLSRLTLGESVV